MGRQGSNLTFKFSDPVDRFTEAHDIGQQLREPWELQHILALRLRKFERVARHNQTGETG